MCAKCIYILLLLYQNQLLIGGYDLPNVDVNIHAPSGGLDEDITSESRFIPSVVFDENKSTDSAQEQAFILAELYHKAAEMHLKLEFKSLVCGTLFMLIGAIVAVWGYTSATPKGTVTAGLILIILAVLILVYGFFIHKPKKLIFLSKVYTITHIIPFESVLIIDGTDVVPDQTLHYNDIPLDDIVASSQKLPNSSTAFECEQQLVTILQEKQRLLGDLHSFSLTTPALLSDDIYTEAILESMHISQSGEAKHGVLNVKVDYQRALEHANKIRHISGLGDSLPIINHDKDIMKERTEPFLQNFASCISDIDAHFEQVSSLMYNHFFTGIDIHADPTADKLYGYGAIAHKYHIPLGCCPRDLIPLNPVQNVIDILDDSVKDATSATIRSAENIITYRKQSCSDMIQQIKQNYDAQINQLNVQISDKRSYIQQLSSRRNMFLRQADEFESTYKHYQKNQRQIEANNAKQQADNAISQADDLLSQINTVENQIDGLDSNINRLNIQKDSEIETQSIKAERDINKLENDLKEDIERSRSHIEPIIEARDAVITIMETFAKDGISEEQHRHRYLFKDRLNLIQNLLQENLSEFDLRLEERSNVLEQVDSISINTSVDKPLSLMIPYWVACFEGKNGDEHILIPIQKTQKPDEPLKGKKTASILAPLIKSLESSKHHLEKEFVYEGAAAYSVYPGKLTIDISNAIDSISQSGYISVDVANRMKKEYDIKGGE